MSPEQRQRLFEFLKHGDEDHRAWLKKAIDAFFEGKPRPPVRDGSTRRTSSRQL